MKSSVFWEWVWKIRNWSVTPIFVLESTLQWDDAQFIKWEILSENYFLGQRWIIITWH